jgi:transcriptional regulator with XRE-family HTH domain
VVEAELSPARLGEGISVAGAVREPEERGAGLLAPVLLSEGFHEHVEQAEIKVEIESVNRGDAGHWASIHELWPFGQRSVRCLHQTAVVPTQRTQSPFVDELPRLLEERKLSLRALAREMKVGDDHLSRVLRGARAKRPTPDLVRRAARALGLPGDYFPEARLDFVVHELPQHPQLLDRIYDDLRSTAQKPPAP